MIPVWPTSWQKISKDRLLPSQFSRGSVRSRSVELKRLVVGAPNRGLGRKLLSDVAERAFGEHCAHRLVLDVFVTNDRARHVYETFGFQKEGIMRDAIYRDGAFHSLVLMSLLESEYRRKI